MAGINPTHMSDEEVMNALLEWLKKLDPPAAEFYTRLMIRDLVLQLNQLAQAGYYFNRGPDGNYGFIKIRDERRGE